MNLSIHKEKVDSNINSEKLNYIESYCLDIKDEMKVIGKVNGYRLHIPLLLNDLLTEEFSFIELDEISQLCSILWSYLSENLDLLKGRNGYLYFFNNLHIYEPHSSFEKELEVLKLLEQKNDIIIYSSGNTELFDDYFIKETVEDDCIEQDVRLIENGWSKDFEYGFLIKSCELSKIKRYKNYNELSIKEVPLEHWVKSKGTEWIQSLWSGLLKQPRFKEDWTKIKFLQKVNQEEYDSSGYLNAIHFLKKLVIKDYKQYEPESGYICNPPSYAKNLRDEGLIIHFNRKKYAIFFTQEYLEMDEETLDSISIGVYEEKEKGFIFGDEELFDDILFSWIESFFLDLFKRIYAQYKAESNIVKEEMSVFRLALNGPVLITSPSLSMFQK